MKANEAPEKIYLFDNPITETPDDRWLSKRSDENDIEYTRTDAFIEKACKYLFENYHGEKLSLKMIEDFKHYMKGE